jgi:SagB-type dehydrogenase family enzyme
MMLFDLYHENSKLSKWDWEPLALISFVNTSTEFATIGDQSILDFGALEHCVQLPEPASLDKPLGEALRTRRSATAFVSSEIDVQTLSTILHWTAGISGALLEGGVPVRPLRYHPSAGGLYAVTVAAEVLSSHDVEPGVYAYDPIRHVLGSLPADGPRIANAVRQGPEANPCSCRIWLMCRFQRLAFKYGERAYRFALLECGHVAQNVLLVATACGLDSRPYAGFFDDEVIAAMGLKPYGLQPIYFISIGTATTM